MSFSPVAFAFETQPVRTINQNGDVWFVATDICSILGLTNTSMALESLDDDEKDTLSNTEGIADNRAQSFNIINESGMYALVLRSRKPAAKRFRKWITAEVIPSIRKTGSYSTEQPQPTPLTAQTYKGEFTNCKMLANDYYLVLAEFIPDMRIVCDVCFQHPLDVRLSQLVLNSAMNFSVAILDEAKLSDAYIQVDLPLSRAEALIWAKAKGFQIEILS